jgi:hypothetical protein
MVICASHKFEFSVSKDMEKIKLTIIIKRRILAYLLAYLSTLIVKILKMNVEQGKVVTILNIIKH